MVPNDKGPEVVVAPAALAERELFKREARNVKAVAIDFDDIEEAANEDKIEGELMEKKEADEEGDIGTAGKLAEGSQLDGDHASVEVKYKELSPETMVHSMKVLQRGASSLLRFLVAVSMRQASLATLTGPEGSEIQRSPDDAPNRTACVRQPASPKSQGRPSRADRRSVAPLIPPTRERSMYGTPFKDMQTHVDSLHQVTV